MKAIRDKIPRDTPGRRYAQVEGLAYVDLLVIKLHEEASEINEAILKDMDDKKEIANELADIIEVAWGIAVRLEIPVHDIEEARVAKLIARGGFKDGWIVA